MSGFKGDYMGFTYNGQHSSNLGIVRTSNGSRFNENLLPTMQDKTTQVPGGDGTYYFGSYYTQKSFNLSFAFDSLTEEKLVEIKRIFFFFQIHELIFDEVPYKVYSAKVTGTATIKHLPFSEGKTNRIYKGEGTIQFTCLYPFARCWSTKKEDYYQHPAYLGLSKEEIDLRMKEWWDASKIDQGGNFGDIEAPFKKEISGEGQIGLRGQTITWKLPEGIKGTLDTKTGLAIAEDGRILNRYLTGNTTLKIPVDATPEEVEGLEFICQYF